MVGCIRCLPVAPVNEISCSSSSAYRRQLLDEEELLVLESRSSKRKSPPPAAVDSDAESDAHSSDEEESVPPPAPVRRRKKVRFPPSEVPPSSGFDVYPELTCHICFEPYFMCLILPCTHSMCRHCLVTLMENRVGSSQAVPDCPDCRDTNVRGPTARMPLLNRPVNELVEHFFLTQVR